MHTVPKTKYANDEERIKARNERRRERRLERKSKPFDVIRGMSPKERRAVCTHNIAKGSVYACRVGGVDYNDCSKCPLATAAIMHPLVRTLWYNEMKRIGYF